MPTKKHGNFPGEGPFTSDLEEDRRETMAEALQSAGAKLPPFGFASRSPTEE